MLGGVLFGLGYFGLPPEFYLLGNFVVVDVEVVVFGCFEYFDQ